jgi:hypothetical protein
VLWQWQSSAVWEQAREWQKMAANRKKWGRLAEGTQISGANAPFPPTQFLPQNRQGAGRIEIITAPLFWRYFLLFILQIYYFKILYLLI